MKPDALPLVFTSNPFDGLKTSFKKYRKMKISGERFYWNKNLHWFIWPSLATWKYKNMTQVNVFFLRFDYRITITTNPDKKSGLPITKKFGLMDI